MNQAYAGGFAAVQSHASNGSTAAPNGIHSGLSTPAVQSRPTSTLYCETPTWPAATAQATLPSQQSADLPRTVTLQLIPETPLNGQGAYEGSIKALLNRNVGHYIVAWFFIGTQGPVSWEGFLHSVGTDYLIISQPDLDRYITCDLYSLKFVELHDQKGVVPACAGACHRDGTRPW